MNIIFHLKKKRTLKVNDCAVFGLVSEGINIVECVVSVFHPHRKVENEDKRIPKFVIKPQTISREELQSCFSNKPGSLSTMESVIELLLSYTVRF